MFNNKKSFIFLLLVFLLLSINVVSAANPVDSAQNALSESSISDMTDDLGIEDNLIQSSSNALAENNLEDKSAANSMDNIGVAESDGNSIDDDISLAGDTSSNSLDVNGMDLASNINSDEADQIGNGKATLGADLLTAGENLIYVSPTGSTSGDGSRNNPYRNVSAAISHLDPDASNVIVLMDGTYNITRGNNFTFKGSNLVIKADDGAKPIVNFMNRQNYRWNFVGTNITLSGITFQNTSFMQHQINITNSTKVLVDNCNFENFRYTGFDITNSSDVTISNSNFTNVQTISITNSNVTFSGNEFTNSSMTLSSKSVGIIDSNNFTNRTATAIEISGSNATISNNNFVNNSYSDNLIANDYTGVTAVISNNHFENNNGTVSAIKVRGNVTIDRNTFINNYANSSGSAIDAYGNQTITNNKFINNAANSTGGAITANGNQTITNNEFINNTAPSGGAIYFTGKQNISNNKFENNNATGFGGAIYSNKTSNSTIENNTFINNTATEGGALFIDFPQNAQLDNKSKYNNTNVSVISNTFTDNSALSGGGVVIYANDSLVKNNTFTGNNASRYGGGALVTGGNNTAIILNNFTNNSAFLYGGAIGTNDSDIINNTFTGNSAYQGGAICTINSTIENNTFDSNEGELGPEIVYLDNYFYPVDSNCTCECANCTHADGCTCECENCNCSGVVPINLLNNNTGLTDVAVYNESDILYVVANYDGLYWVNDKQNITDINQARNWAFCIEKENLIPWENNGTSGIIVHNLTFVRNSLDQTYVGDYIKTIISLYGNDFVNESSMMYIKELIFVFTDTNYTASEDPIIKEIMEIAGDSTFNNGNNYVNGTWNCLNFYSLINPLTRQNLILINGCSELPVPDFNVSKETDTRIHSNGDIVNYLVTIENTGQISLNNVTVREIAHRNLEYVGFNDFNNDGWELIGDLTWQLNRALKVGNKTQFNITFRVVDVPSAQVIPNTIEAWSLTVDVKNDTEEIEVILPKLEIEKIAIDKNVYFNETVRYTIKVTNKGRVASNKVVVVENYNNYLLNYTGIWSSVTGYWSGGYEVTYDDLMGEYALNRVVQHFSRDGKYLYFVLNGPLNPGQSASFNITFKARNASSGSPENYVSVYDNTTYQNETYNLTNIGNISYGVEKYLYHVNNGTTNPNQITIGDEVTYRIHIFQKGTANIQKLIVRELPSDGLEFVRFYTNKNENYQDINWTYYSYNNTLESTGLFKSPYGYGQDGIYGYPLVLYVVFKVTKFGILDNFINVSNNQSNFTNTSNKTIESTPYQLTVKKIANEQVGFLGDLISYTIRVTNTGFASLTKVGVTEKPQTGLIFHHYTCNDSNWVSDDNVTWNYNGIFKPKDTVDIIVYYNVTESVLQRNKATAENNVTAFSNETDNQTARNSTPIINFTVQKISNNPQSTVGDMVSFTIVVSNKDYIVNTYLARPHLVDVFVAEFAQDGLVYDHFEDESGKWSYDESANKWVYKGYNGEFGVNVTRNFTVFYNVTKVGNLKNTIVVGSNNTTNTTTDNKTQSSPKPSLDVMKITLNKTVYTGEQTQFMIVVTNTGNCDLGNVEVTDDVPEGLSYASFVDDTGKWSNDGLTWYYDGTLAPGESAGFVIIFDTDKTGNFTNTVTARSNETEEVNSTNVTEVINETIPPENDTNKTPDVPDVPDTPTPDTPEKPTKIIPKENIVEGGISSIKAGNPIVALILVLMVLVFSPIRRRKK